jgi:hypothetical protein
MDTLTRRQALAGISSVSAASLAGCSDALNIVTGGPDPVVLDSESGQGLGDAISGNFDIRVLVRNDGDEGPVQVTVTTYDSNGNTLDRFRQTVTIRSDERRRVDFTVSPSSGAERYEASAEAA